jgi:class 3 adenylate cyclase
MVFIIFITVILSFLGNFWISNKHFMAYDAFIRENSFQDTLQLVNSAISENRNALAKEAHLLGQLPILNAVVNTKDAETIRDSIQSFHRDLNISIIEILDNNMLFITNIEGSHSLLEQNSYQNILSGDSPETKRATSLIAVENGVAIIAIAPIGVPPDHSGWIMLGRRLDSDFLKSIRNNELIKLSVQDKSGKVTSSTNNSSNDATPPFFVSDSDSLLKSQNLKDEKNQLIGSLIVEFSLKESQQRITRMKKAFILYGTILLLLILFIGSVSTTYLMNPILRLSQRLSELISADALKKIEDQKFVFLPGHGELRNTAVLFIDLRSFSSLSLKLQPDDVMMILTKYQSLAISIVEKFGGHVDKFMGDGILIHFTSEIEYDIISDNAAETYAKNCFYALLELMKGFSNDNWCGPFTSELKVVFTCSVGPAIFGVVGNEVRKEFTIIGQPVNTAAKIENHAKHLNINNLVTLEAYNLAIKQGFNNSNVKVKKMHENVVGIHDQLDLVTFDLL